MAPLPRWIRYTILAVAVPILGVGLVLALYSRGWLPIAGPFVVMALVPALLLGRALWWRRRIARLSRTVVADLERTRELAAAAQTPPGSAGLPAEVVEAAGDRADAARQKFAWGQEAAGVALVAELGALARTWPPSPLQAQITRTAGSAGQLAEVLRKVQRFAEHPARR